MGIKVTIGRNFDDRDMAAPGERDWRSAIVNERYLGGRNPLGVRICEGSGPEVAQRRNSHRIFCAERNLLMVIHQSC
jgi:hypothetical protein